MSLFAQLIEEVADEKNHTLSACLLKAKLLASKLNSRKFRNWVDNELTGYDKEEAPSYRDFTPLLLGTYVTLSTGQMQENVYIDTSNLDPSIRKQIAQQRFTQNIRELEAMLGRPEGPLHFLLPPELVVHLQSTTGRELKLVRGIPTKECLQGVLHNVRTKLLDFLIELRIKHPDLEDNDQAVKNVLAEEVNKAFDKAFHNEFYNCNVSIGDQKVAKQEIKGRDFNVQGSGNFVAADDIGNSFNAVAESQASAEVKETLQQLAAAVTELCIQLPTTKQQEVAGDFKTLVNEATKTPPNKSRLEAFGNLLKETAKTVASVGPGLIAVVDRLISLFP